MRVNLGQVPPGGWHFPEGPGLTFRADTYEKLADMIFAHRLRSGKDIGNIKAEINRYYCAKWPHACLMEATDYGHKGSGEKPEGLPNQVARFASLMATRMPAGGYALVNQDIADKRAAACAKCPRNTPWKTGCNSCSASTASLLLQIRKLRNTKLDPQLMACSLFGVENSTAIHLPYSVQVPDENDAPLVPPGCWKLDPELQ